MAKRLPPRIALPVLLLASGPGCAPKPPLVEPKAVAAPPSATAPATSAPDGPARAAHGGGPERGPTEQMPATAAGRQFAAWLEWSRPCNESRDSGGYDTLSVGEGTCGGAHPTQPYPVTGGFVLMVPWGESINPVTSTNWEGIGVIPDVEVPLNDAPDTAHHLALERLGGH